MIGSRVTKMYLSIGPHDFVLFATATLQKVLEKSVSDLLPGCWQRQLEQPHKIFSCCGSGNQALQWETEGAWLQDVLTIARPATPHIAVSPAPPTLNCRSVAQRAYSVFLLSNPLKSAMRAKPKTTTCHLSSTNLQNVILPAAI
jgi:hypothetical protein